MPDIKNPSRAGTCAHCQADSARLFDPPLILPEDWHAVSILGDEATWSPPRSPAKSKRQFYNLVFHDGLQYLRPPGKNDPICWKCYAGNVSPHELEFVVNKPGEFTFDGLNEPHWLGS